MNAIIGLIRHILTFAGGFVVASGDIAEPQLDTLVGALVTVVGIVWSVLEKRKKKSIPTAIVPMLLIPLMVACVALPSGCVRGVDGEVTMDPNAKTFLTNAAKVAVLIGVSHATAGVSELAPFTGVLSSGINNIFASNEDPKEIGNELKMLFSDIALQIGNEELNQILLESVKDQLVPDVPGAVVGGADQYQYNSKIAEQLVL